MTEEYCTARMLLRIFHCKGKPIPEIRSGQVIDVLARNSNNQEILVPLTVLVVLPNGDYIGEVIWALA